MKIKAVRFIRENARRALAVFLIYNLLLMSIPVMTLPFVSAETGVVSGSDVNESADLPVQEPTADKENTADNTFNEESSDDNSADAETEQNEVSDTADTSDELSTDDTAKDADASENEEEADKTVISDSDAETVSASDVEEDITVTHPAFSGVRTIGGINISVSAPVGVFPEGVTLSVNKVGMYAKNRVDSLIGSEADDSYTFDIKVLLNGEEIQPDTTYGNVSVRFALDVPSNADIDVYHIDDAITSVESLAPVVGNDTVSVVTESFSYFTIEITYQELTLVLHESTAYSVGLILDPYGIYGEIESIVCSDSEAITIDANFDIAVKQEPADGTTLTVTMKDGRVYVFDVVLGQFRTSARFYFEDSMMGQPFGVDLLNSDGTTDGIYIDTGDGNIIPYSKDAVLANVIVWVYTDNTEVVSIDVNEGDLITVDCEDLGISSLDVTNCSTLKELYCDNNNLDKLDLTGCSMLEHLSCDNNQLTSLDLSDCTTIKNIYCSGNEITDLDFSPDAKDTLELLWCSNNNLSAISVEGFTALRSLMVIENPSLSTLTLGGNEELFYFLCSDCSIEELDLSDCSALRTFYCYNNKLKSLDLSACSALESLMCKANQLTDISFADSCDALYAFDCSENQLTQLELPVCKSLQTIHCYDNKLTQLDVSDCPVLSWLDCEENELTTLDLSNNSDLAILIASRNQLSDITVSDQAPLSNIVLNENRLTFLNLPVPAEESGFYYDNQAPIEIPETIEPGQTITALVPQEANEDTVFVWFESKYLDESYSDEDLVMYNDDPTSSEVTFTADDIGKTFVCGMYNDNYMYSEDEGVVILTTEVTVVGSTYTVSFDANGGSGTMNAQKIVCGSVDTALNENVFTKENAAFLGWNTDKTASEALYSDKATITSDLAAAGETVTLYAVWKLGQYTISFDSNGGSDVADITQDFGSAVTAPADPTREGYTFDGWDAEIPATMPAENITLTAKWKINQYTISFDTTGGSDVADITKDFGSAVTAPADPTREGYTFDGWDAEIPATMPAENITLIAKWKINQYTISFDSNGGSDVADITKDFGSTVTAPADPTREGYTFDGWDAEIPATMPAENITLTAKWKINQYTISFDTTGGSDVADITKDFGSAVTAPADPTREGYTFDGWDAEIPATMPAENITLTAKWEINQYTISFDTTGGSDVADITKDFGSAVTAPADPTREGYTFDGWDIEIPATMPAENITLTAKWKINQYTISFDTTGGSDVADITQDFGSTVTAPADPTREGYTFDGWDAEIPATMPAENITITALWKANQYIVIFKDSIDEVTVGEVTVDYSTAATAPEAPVHEGIAFNYWATEKNGTVAADLSKITDNVTVWAVYRSTPVVGSPIVVLLDTTKTYDVNEAIEFKAVGFWADNTVKAFANGDERYVPLKWHHADPSGDWAGKTAPTDDYSASFKQSKAGNYTLKVEFTKYVYENGSWVDKGIVTVEVQYKVVAPSAGSSSNVPDTGDDGNHFGVVLAINLMIVSGMCMVLYFQNRRRSSNQTNA